jgi:hypothetical protein
VSYSNTKTSSETRNFHENAMKVDVVVVAAVAVVVVVILATSTIRP